MRKERKKRQKNMVNIRLTGIFCLFLGMLFAASNIFSDAGFLLQFISRFQHYLLGLGFFLLPLGLFIVAWQLLVLGQINFCYKKILAVFLVVLCLLGTAHHVFVPVNEELISPAMLDGGGVVGGLTVLFLHKTVGDLFTYVLLIVGLLLGLCLLLPLRKILERLQDKLIEDELTILRPKKVNGKTADDNFGSYQKEFSGDGLGKTKNTRMNSAQNVYNNSEFNAFTEGLQKKGTFKRILNFNNNVYEKEPLKQEIERDPVQLPEWEERKQEVILRPIINYENDNTYISKPYFMDNDKEEESVESILPTDEQKKNTKSIINNIYRSQENTADVSKQESCTTEKITIFNSADKVQNTIVSEPPKIIIPESLPDTESSYKLPVFDLLDMPYISDPATYERDIMEQCAVLEQTLADFKVRAKVIAVTRGPSVTRFELEPAPGVKVNSVVNLADDIALRLAASGVRIEAPIPGKSAIGIEAPNTKNDQVCLREVVEDKTVCNTQSRLCIGLGKDISGDIITADLSKMPHLLVAGSTGSGKSVCINTIIAGILYKAKPDEVKLILVDPKVVELSNYNGIPHLLTPVVTEPKKAASALHWAVAEMERRYNAFADNHVRDIKSYNTAAQEKMPYIVIIIDELSDLMMVAKADVEDAILRLAQKARAAGIHLILATQRPSVDVITGIVKANIPSRIAFAVSSQTDSRTIIDKAGAEKLLGKGDMLFAPMGTNKPIRVQGAFVSDMELEKIVNFIIKQSIPVNYSEEVTEQELTCDHKDNNHDDSSQNLLVEDTLFEDALRIVLDRGQASSSMLQRRFSIGYTRAARLVDTMEELGIVGQAVGSKPREVIMSRQEAEERFLRHE